MGSWPGVAPPRHARVLSTSVSPLESGQDEQLQNTHASCVAHCRRPLQVDATRCNESASRCPKISSSASAGNVAIVAGRLISFPSMGCVCVVRYCSTSSSFEQRSGIGGASPLARLRLGALFFRFLLPLSRLTLVCAPTSLQPSTRLTLTFDLDPVFLSYSGLCHHFLFPFFILTLLTRPTRPTLSCKAAQRRSESKEASSPPWTAASHAAKE